jgi:P-type Ca2+ transporter type 2C
MLAAQAVIEEPGATPASPGLTDTEAAARLASDGPNEIPRAGRRSWLRIAFGTLREPMFALLIAAGVAYLILGDLEEALVLVAFATLSVSIAVVQEARTERVLEALRDLSSPRALVVRNGERRRIAGRDVVRGDLLVLVEGDRVAADALMIAGHDVEIDESLLTGESFPVRKRPWTSGDAPPPAHPGGDDSPRVYSGSLVVRGQGHAEVTATGPRSELGRIGAALATIESEPPRLQIETRRLVLIFGGLGLLLSSATVAFYGLQRGSWLEGVLAGIALGMSLLPEEFPLVLTVFMVMGAWRIARARVLTRRGAAIEALGSATVLCTDKTGTLTLNRMSVVDLRSRGIVWHRGATEPAPPPSLTPLIETAVLASAVNPVDPMERALAELASAPTRHGHALVKTYGLRPELLAVTNVWTVATERDYRLMAKGAPEAIAALCRLSPRDEAEVRQAVDAMARDGIRVLAAASGTVPPVEQWPSSPAAFTFEFVGLIGFADPLRPSVPQAVRECRSAGIRVVMITGDHPTTAAAIARQAGLDATEIVTGIELERMSDAELAKCVRSAGIFARITPEQKFRLVDSLKRNGEVVAMTGDGVNDAPSLKAAHIGIAMGGRGTDVAREASAIVLLDDDFGSIVRTIRLGRRIYDNVRKAMSYVLAVHVPIAGTAMLPLFFGLPIVLTPIHIAFLEMVIDPMCSIVFEAQAEEEDVMRRKPRTPTAPLFSLAQIGWSLLQGLVAFGGVAAVLAIALRLDMSEAAVRAVVFVALVSTNAALIFVNRSFSHSLWVAVTQSNPVLWGVLAIASGLLAVTVHSPIGRRLFRFEAIDFHDFGLAVGAGFGVLVFLEGAKLLLRRELTP